MKKISPHKIILTVIIVITLILGVMIFVYPPAIFPDPSHGFQVMRCMQMGGGFNHLVTPNQDDISKNTSEYLTWWSPGQYLVPYIIEVITGLNIGRATALIITLFELFGLAGFYISFKKIGFTPIIAALSILFIACQQAYVIPYVFYNGGEILLFGFEGWFLYGCISFKKIDLKLLIFVLLSGWIGFFCKSSFIWIYAAGLLYIWLRLSAVGENLNVRKLIKNAIWLGIPAIISVGCIYILFLSKGETPASVTTGLKFSLQSFSFPLASPLVAGFSVDDIMHGLLYPTFTPFLTPEHTLWVLLLMAGLSLILISCIIRFVSKNNYRLFVIVFYLVSILFFTVVYLKQMTISYEGRHFRIIGLLIVPGIIYLVAKFKRPYKISFAVLCLVLLGINYSFFVKGFIFNKNTSGRGTTGFAQQTIDQQSLNYLLKLNAENKDAIFVFITPDLPLEITHNRIIILDPIIPGDQINYDDYSYDGHAGPLYLLLPANYSAKQDNTAMKFFPGYKDFACQKLGNNYVLYTAK
ncbi:MAG: hypothetical protein ACHQF4_05300 [Sphingobacteriales bacterium]